MSVEGPIRRIIKLFDNVTVLKRREIKDLLSKIFQNQGQDIDGTLELEIGKDTSGDLTIGVPVLTGGSADAGQSASARAVGKFTVHFGKHTNYVNPELLALVKKLVDGGIPPEVLRELLNTNRAKPDPEGVEEEETETEALEI